MPLDMMPPSPDIVQVNPGFDNTIGGNHGYIKFDQGGYYGAGSGYYFNKPGENIASRPSTDWDDDNPYSEENMPSEEDVYEDHGIPYEKTQVDSGTTGLEEEKDDNNVVEDYSTGASLSEWLQQNPGATYLDALKYMSQYSDTWAEKYLDYSANRDQYLEERNYEAQRADTAYQRMVSDLRAAGLNPALLYSGSASPVSSGSSGFKAMSGDATSAGVSNYSKIKNVMLAYLMYQLQKGLGITNSVFKGVDSLFDAIGQFLPGSNITKIFNYK